MAVNPSIAQPFDFTQDRIYSKQRGLWGQAFQRLIRNRLALASAILLLIIMTVSILASFVPAVQHQDPAFQDYSRIETAPSANNWLGTDGLGRDLWARLLQGTLFSLKM